MTDRYLTLAQTARRLSMCERTLRRYLPEIPHCKNGNRIKIRWTDAVKWMESKKVIIRQDDVVMDILRDMARVQ